MTDTPPQVRPFADFLREQARGTTHDELSEGLRDLVQRVKETGRKGSLTLVLTVEPQKGAHNVLIVTDEIKTKLPEFERQASFFFSTADGNLTRNDPDQLAFESLAAVPPGVNPTTGEIAPAQEA